MDRGGGGGAGARGAGNDDRGVFFMVRFRRACCMHSLAISSSVWPMAFSESVSRAFHSASSWSISLLVRPVPAAMAAAEGGAFGWG